MTKILSINNIGMKGLNTDLAPWELEPEFLTFGINFRVTGNTVKSTNAFDVWTTAPVDYNAGHVISADVSTGDFWLTPGRSAVWVYDGTNWSDVSSAEGYAALGVDDELLWTSAMLGDIPIINNAQSFPEYWSPQSTGQIMQRLEFSPGNTWQDVNKSFKIIRSHNNFLFALGLIEGGEEQPNSYRWSHPAALNGLPFTWDENDDSSIASIEQILGDSGAIVDGRSLRDGFCIYSERGVNILDFTGGEFVFRNRELSSTYGLLNRNCIAEVSGVHYFLGDGDILRNDGNAITSIVYNRIRKRINTQLNADFFHRSFVVENKAQKEVWFCVPENTSEYPNTAYIYNYDQDSWSIKSLPDNIAFADYGSIAALDNSWDANTDTWNSSIDTWGRQGITPLNRTVVAVDTTDSSLVIISPLVASGAVDISARIERTDFPLDGLHKVTMLTRIFPGMIGTTDVEIQVGSQQYPGGPVNWKPAQIFNPATDRKLDVRTSGELHAWRVQSVGTGHWELSGMTFEYQEAGER